MTEHGARGHGGHLDLLQLDAVRAGEGTAADLAHLAGCPRCREELEVVKRLADGVAELQPPRAPIPEAVDRAVLDAFRRQREARPVTRFPWWRWAAPAAGLAAAASIAVFLLLPRLTPGPDTTALREEVRVARGAGAPVRPAASSARRGDVNGDGTLDILDAYRLALLMRAGSGEAASWDENGDGVVDRADVDALAVLAVAL